MFRTCIQATIRLTVMCALITLMGFGVLAATFAAGAVLGQMIP